MTFFGSLLYGTVTPITSSKYSVKSIFLFSMNVTVVGAKLTIRSIAIFIILSFSSIWLNPNQNQRLLYCFKKYGCNMYSLVSSNDALYLMLKTCLFIMALKSAVKCSIPLK